MTASKQLPTFFAVNTKNIDWLSTVGVQPWAVATFTTSAWICASERHTSVALTVSVQPLAGYGSLSRRAAHERERVGDLAGAVGVLRVRVVDVGRAATRGPDVGEEAVDRLGSSAENVSCRSSRRRAQ